MPKTAESFTCIECNFKCSKQSNWNKHILTAKHKSRMNTNIIMPKNAVSYECDCGKKYKHASSLWNHKQSCNNEHESIYNQTNDNTPDIEKISDTTLVVELVRQNKEFKQMLLDQTKQMMELASKSHVVNNTTNNNNQRFNINLFLNDTCKDAMNITDFLRDIDVQNNELEYIGHNGYVTGMTKMITDRLKSMDVTKRPIHCTDIKRETMYIKDDGVWCKDTEELSKLRKILGRISMNNYRSVAKWKESHPESEILASRTYDFCYRMMQALLGDVEDEQIRLDNKIIKSMASTLYVNKNITSA